MYNIGGWWADEEGGGSEEHLLDVLKLFSDIYEMVLLKGGDVQNVQISDIYEMKIIS